ncbi:hypothetical protein A3B18_02190 [Candidatus Giovannonibacteria bacterium RIFCSPLOWO2_01_FULL_46_13]|uniref:Uncharacterized protein n=1 Tax=Candidatus Giovannonibacteria bacterium RIFCSPLOWO2_01_FULL_46_13 TaxID=1798352 RepID=A0A1F5X3B6_9BACT|nr:MAG: hypothetical protein A3B18_02190 [Candidatus Giovannonibacteria bacterium RIFCSPLOWO2_01_FULL_46_13]
MINLLPYEDKKTGARENLRRFLVMAISFVSIVVLFGIILIVPTFISLRVQRESLKDEEANAKSGAPLDRLKEIEVEINKLNSRLGVLESRSGSPVASDAIKKVIDSAPGGISVEEISFSEPRGLEPAKIILNGMADKREDLVAFVKSLEDSGEYDKVDSPLSNILKKTEVDFSLSLNLKK